MIAQQAEEKGYQYHCAGFHCAEAVCLAVWELFGNGDSMCLPQAATALGGGIGGTQLGDCGALTGGVLVLGLLCGRRQPKGDKKAAYALAGELQRRFKAEYGATGCADILAAFGEQQDMDKCKRLSGRTAGMLARMLEQRAEL